MTVEISSTLALMLWRCCLSDGHGSQSTYKSILLQPSAKFPSEESSMLYSGDRKIG